MPNNDPESNGLSATLTPSIAVPSVTAGVRPCVKGKFLFVDDEKLYVCGVTYGPFLPSGDRNEPYDPEVAEWIFADCGKWHECGPHLHCAAALAS